LPYFDRENLQHPPKTFREVAELHPDLADINALAHYFNAAIGNALLSVENLRGMVEVEASSTNSEIITLVNETDENLTICRDVFVYTLQQLKKRTAST